MNFVYLNQNVINDLFYILSSIFVYFFIYEHGKLFKRSKQLKQLLMVVCLSVPLILCMKFPIYIAEDCVHDLRQLPFLLGTLYGGWPVGTALLIILLITRFFLYGFNFLTIVVYVTMLIIAALSSAKFKQLSKRNKLVMSTALTFFLAILTTWLAVLIADFQVTNTYIIDFIIIPPIGILFVVYITETLRAAITMKSQLIKMEKMEIVSQLAASISHEVRNPLTVVKGFAQLLKAGNLPQQSKEQYVDHILRELDHAQVIIDDYLTFAKPAPHKVEKILIEEELKRAIEMMRPLAKVNAVTIAESLETGAISGNVQHFHQCFLNLMKNGIEAMPSGGTLTVCSYSDEHTIVIKIKDSGIGMTNEQRNRFGEPYFSTKTKGTGLGSMVAVRIIEAMRGTLHIESVVSKGTTLTITFPKYEDRM